jgi:hypothetical protein
MQQWTGPVVRVGRRCSRRSCLTAGWSSTGDQVWDSVDSIGLTGMEPTLSLLVLDLAQTVVALTVEWWLQLVMMQVCLEGQLCVGDICICGLLSSCFCVTRCVQLAAFKLAHSACVTDVPHPHSFIMLLSCQSNSTPSPCICIVVGWGSWALV